MSRGWEKVSACHLQVTLSCALSSARSCPSRICPRSSLHLSASLPCGMFLSLWSPSGDMRGPSVVFEAADVPCPGLPVLYFSHITDYIYDFCPLPGSDVGPSVLVCVLSILLSVLVFAAASWFCACLVSVQVRSMDLVCHHLETI